MALRIDFHPAARRPALAAVVAFAVGMVGSAVFALVKLPVVAGGLTLAFAASLVPYFLPTVYEFDDQSILVRRLWSTRRFAWSRFRAFERDKNGVFLSPYRKRCRLDSARGVFLPLDRQGKDRLIPMLEERLIER